MATANVLIMLHGITLSDEAEDHTAEYTRFWEALKAQRPELEAVGEPVMIEWGHEPPEPPPGGLRGDQKVRRAENFLDETTDPARAGGDPSRFDHPLGEPGPFLTELVSRRLLRPRLLTPFKQRLMVRGLTDVIYYSSPEGERAVREAVYGEVLRRLEPLRGSRVQLHVVAHSLGVTVAFDFLFGLFGPKTPDFIAQPGRAADRYGFWREQVAAGGLRLGSKTSAGGQLPLLMMRKQALVDQLAAGRRLSAEVIGVRPDGPPQWNIFYDPDDPLGFPARRLFPDQEAIHEYEVETSWLPVRAHTGYWDNGRVQRETADLIAGNL